MYNGLPVIGSRVGGIPDMVQDGVNGWLVPPRDVAALASALRQALREPDIDAMSAHARETAQRVFSTDQYVAGYRRLLNAAYACIQP
jgi:glycosyltransferase involved in cell wall biosynthesis